MAAGTTAIALPQSGGMAEWIGKKIKTAADQAKAKREELQNEAAEKGEEYKGKPGSLFSQGLGYQFSGKYRDRLSSSGVKNPLELKKTPFRKPKSSSIPSTPSEGAPKTKPKTLTGSLGAIVNNTNMLVGIASTQNKILSVQSGNLENSNQLLQGIVTINSALLKISSSILEVNRDQLAAQEYSDIEKSLEGKQDAADILKVKSPYEQDEENDNKRGGGGIPGLGNFASKIFARGLGRAPGRLAAAAFGKRGLKATSQIGKIGSKILSPLAKTMGGAGLGLASKLVPKSIQSGVGKLAPKIGAKAGGAVAKGAGKSLIKKIPILGAIAGVGFGIQRAMQGDWLGAAGELASGAASTVPGLGTGISLGIDAALLGRDLTKGGTPQMAEGGIVDNPTTFRAGEAGPELVMPLSKLMDTGLGSMMPGFKKNPKGTMPDNMGTQMQDLMALPMKTIGGSILAISGQFIKALGPVGSAIAPVLGALIGPLEKTFGVPGSLVKFDIGGSVRGSGSDANSKKQSVQFLKTLLKALVPGGGLIAGMLGGGKEEETTETTQTTTNPSSRGSVPGGEKKIEELVAIAQGAGFKGDNAAKAAAVAYAESTGNPRAHNDNYKRGGGDNSYGLWQINMIDKPGYMLGEERRKKFGLKSNEDLFDPATNAEIAYKLSGGSNFRAWTTFPDKMNQHIDKARAALKKNPQMAKGGIVVTSRKGQRMLNGVPDLHEGTDIAAPEGTPLYAFDDGKVTDIRTSGGYGNSVYWTDSKGWGHLYAHMAAFGKGVRKSLSFKKGKILGSVGSTGRSTGPHLHWEMAANPNDTGRPKGQPGRIDPLSRYNYMTPFTGKPQPGDGVDSSAPGSSPNSTSPSAAPTSALAALPPDATPEQRMEAAKTDFMNLATPALSSVQAVAQSFNPPVPATEGTEPATTPPAQPAKPTGPAGGPFGMPTLLPGPMALFKKLTQKPKPKVGNIPPQEGGRYNPADLKQYDQSSGRPKPVADIRGGDRFEAEKRRLQNVGNPPPKPAPAKPAASTVKPAKPAAPQSGSAKPPTQEKTTTSQVTAQPSIITTNLPPISADDKNPSYGGSAKNLEPWALSTHQIFANN